MKTFKRVVSIIVNVCEGVALLSLTVGVALLTVNLVMRNFGYAINIPGWIQDAATFSLVMGSFLYMAVTDRHIGFNGLVQLSSSVRARQIMTVIVNLVIITVMFILAFAGLNLVNSQRPLGALYSSNFTIRLAWFLAIAPVAFFICALRVLANITQDSGLETDPARGNLTESRDASSSPSENQES